MADFFGIIPKKFRKPRRLSSQRITALDLARFAAMLMMIQGHTIYALASPEAVIISEFPWNVWHFLRGITAPVFLIVSGAVHVFANKRDEEGMLPESRIRRRIKIALLLIGIGYFLHFPVARIWDIFYITEAEWLRFYRVNILQLIGAALVILLMFYIFTRKDKTLAISTMAAAIFIFLSTPFIETIDFYEHIPGFFAAYLNKQGGSLFPLFPYAGYLLFGTTLGVILKKMEPEKRTKFLQKWGIPSGLVFLAIGGIMYMLFDGINYKYYAIADSGFIFIFIRIGMVLAGLSIIAWFYEKTSEFSEYYSIFGKRALFIYVVHLILIYGSDVFKSFYHIYKNSLTVAEVIPFAILIMILSVVITYFYDFSLYRFPKIKDYYRYGITAYLVFVIFF